MKSLRTDEQIERSGYIRTAEIARYFCIGIRSARAVYKAAEHIDKEELENRIFPTMVRLSSVYKAMGLAKKKNDSVTALPRMTQKSHPHYIRGEEK